MYISNIKARKVVYLMMQHRNSTQSAIFSSLEDNYFTRKPVRFIDAFVEALSLET
jgi:hypothetical protein